VLPGLYRLADSSAPFSHAYHVDGSPTVADICVSTPCAGVNDWRTILVAGLNSGGRGYYALDVTNPLAPKALW
jgi:type IV pilus assembly protein PilY1